MNHMNYQKWTACNIQISTRVQNSRKINKYFGFLSQWTWLRRRKKFYWKKIKSLLYMCSTLYLYFYGNQALAVALLGATDPRKFPKKLISLEKLSMRWHFTNVRTVAQRWIQLLGVAFWQKSSFSQDSRSSSSMGSRRLLHPWLLWPGLTLKSEANSPKAFILIKKTVRKSDTSKL